MKKLLFGLFVLLVLNAYSQEDYLLNINGKSVPLALDKLYEMQFKGETLKMRLSQPDSLKHTSKLFSFLYPKGFKVSTSQVGEGVEQTAILTAEGSGFLVQQYESLNPTTLNETMITELTKESVNYGFKMARSVYKKTLVSGQTLDIIRVVLTYNDDINTYEVASIGKKDSGVLVVTMRMDNKKDSGGEKAIQMLWSTLAVKL